ncbi:unnamed protein product, partial [Mesorhabditis spiculigera]
MGYTVTDMCFASDRGFRVSIRAAELSNRLAGRRVEERSLPAQIPEFLVSSPRPTYKHDKHIDGAAAEWGFGWRKTCT